MLVSAAEPILHTTSNSVFAFIFCNLIVLLIFLGSRFDSGDSKTRDALQVFGVQHDLSAEIADIERFSSDQIVSSSRHAKQGEEKLAMVKVTEVNWEEEQEDDIGECKDEEESRHSKQGEEKLAIVKVTEVNWEEEHEDDIGECKDEEEKEEDDHEDENEDDGEEANDDGDDNELRRRIEDFIAKVNNEWKAENLKEGMPSLTQFDELLGVVATSANAPSSQMRNRREATSIF